VREGVLLENLRLKGDGIVGQIRPAPTEHTDQHRNKKKTTGVIPITSGQSISKKIADLAFQHWLERSFRRGSPERDFLQAVIEVTCRANARTKSKARARSPIAPGLFVVRKA
jgi:hypothetical protein